MPDQVKMGIGNGVEQAIQETGNSLLAHHPGAAFHRADSYRPDPTLELVQPGNVNEQVGGFQRYDVLRGDIIGVWIHGEGQCSPFIKEFRCRGKAGIAFRCDLKKIGLIGGAMQWAQCLHRGMGGLLIQIVAGQCAP